MRRAALLLSASLLLPAAATAQQLTSQVVASGFSQPVAYLADPTLADTQYVVQQDGRIRTIRNGTVQATDFLDIRNSGFTSGGERGLLGFAFAPDYATSGRCFISFTNANGDKVIARFKRSTSDPRRADMTTRFDLLWPGGSRFIPQPFANHNAGNLQFGPDGYLYIGLGDGGAGGDPGNRAQTPSTLLGKFLRIDVSVPDSDVEGYDVPATNPFVNQIGYLPEIWSFGWRNPWRYSFDSFGTGATGALIVGDVGQNAYEEIDYEPANRGGRNYGWRLREGAHPYDGSLPPAYTPLRDPIYDYGRSIGSTVVGGYVYRGALLPASYRGRYFFADFGSARIWSMSVSIDGAGDATMTGLTEHTAELGGNSVGSVSSFGIDASGELYLVCYGTGQIRRIVNATPASQLLMSLDAPAAGTISQPFILAGWAIDRAQTNSTTGVDIVHVWAFDAGGAGTFVGANYGGPRADVAAAYGPSYQNSGFAITVSGLAAGTYQLVAYAHSGVTGQFEGSRSVQVTIVGGPLMAMDTPPHNSTVPGRFPLSGWAIDRDSGSGTGVDTVHVWAYPVSGSPRFVGQAAYGGSRPDVGAVYGSRFTNSGWSLIGRGLPAGTWTLVASMHSTTTNTFRLSSVATVQVLSGALLQIDAPPPSSVTRPFQIIGWAVDLAAASGTGISAVHVWAFPVGGGGGVFIGAATLGLNRTDVGNIFGSQFNQSGYQLTWGSSLPAGTFDLAVYGQSSVSGAFDVLKVIRLTVQ